ncbi:MULTISPECIES: iron ABC transporter permease [unclassified Micromonospora]|uniref:FecCD family ABC transporter permease n=1 Tax=unclassified Micromonospora TaxID=2617518 RepID=UPI00188EDB40|nr:MULTISPECIES: iron ABC transporter permease [unclassified Micromonospora]MBF5031001.1 iron ABC transporter permease [Micromonospora sp. ANENR4]MCZ7474369.1 iron ABC transporter permease [Micromonospora sp. WMMC273]WBC05020.1 iron ABC transporter permease [Micromonospora sp. WMMA1976]
MTTVAVRPARAGAPVRRGTVRRVAVTVAAALLLLLALLASLALGSRHLPVDQVWHALVSPDGGDATTVVRELRMPRTALGLVVGLALALAGVLFQAVTRNPLAEPRILGISAGASFGVVLAIAVFGVGTLAGYVWFGIAGALLAGLLVFAIANRTREGASPVTLALVGAALDAGLGAIVYALLSIDARTFEEYRFWVVGGLTGRGVGVAGQVLPFVVAGVVLAALAARGLDALALGDDVARGLGHRVALVRLAAGAGGVLLTGAAVAAAGPIAFVGLAVPHLARALVGADQRWTLLVAALLGPALLLTADVAGRLVAPPGEIPAGIITALLGAPLLAFLVHRAKTVTT